MVKEENEAPTTIGKSAKVGENRSIKELSPLVGDSHPESSEKSSIRVS